MSDENEVLSTEDEVIEQTDAIEPAEKSMDDTIRETLDAINARSAEPEEPLTDDKPRNERGQFVAKNAEPRESLTPSGAVDEPAPDQPPPAPEAAPAMPPELQRLGLRKEAAEAFMAAPQVLKDEFIRRSEEMHKGIEQVRDLARFGHQMGQALNPYMATIQSLGVSPDVAVQKLLTADHSLRYGNPQQKTQMLMQIAKDYGIDLQQVQEYQSAQPYVDPQVAALQGQIQQMQAAMQQRQQQEEAERQRQLYSTFDAFRADPANKYANDVLDDMAGLLQAGVAKDLKDAYERAVYANPVVRAKVLAEQQAKADEERKQKAAQQAKVAKLAASVNLPRKGALPAARAVGSMEDTIRAKAQELGLF